ncbi:unnamed protein product [Parnassius apollo]|uniref:(apollo) hypothetical protein n=1 Tax=Parnassius apollo TaxID=110799 RepID=A0A8S3WAS1_PARAO|nr:unnamed protein product [Parnassius apollo]
MDEQFAKLIKAGKNTLDGLIQWMKDAKIIDGIKVTEQKAREVFSETTDPKNVNLDKFKEALTKLAADQKKSVEEFSKTLADEAPKFIDALTARASTLKDAISKK